jgi:alkylhydroperoxidase/carboxymuconolactone decarboxylase family protein YurZ
MKISDEASASRADHNGFRSDLTSQQRSLDNEFVEKYDAFCDSAESGHALPNYVRELIGLALNVSITHQYTPAAARHLRAAVEAGATERQIIEALELTSVLGIHTVTLSLPILCEEAGYSLDSPLTEQERSVRQRFIEKRNVWADALDVMLRLDQDFLKGYIDFSGVVWDHDDGLEPKYRECIYIAIDATATHLWVGGIRRHIRSALDRGATFAELLEVLKLCALIGFQAFELGTKEYLTLSASDK